MWAAIKLFFSTNAVRVMEWLAIIGGVALAILAVFSAGKKAERTDELAERLKKVGRAHEIEDKNNANLRDGDAAKRLSDDWSR